jgi:redox-sensitive bicupin YhaK (pirin superfamily)
MLNILKSHDRGHFDHGWLDTYHSFSFGDYYDPAKMGFRSLRVLNEDRVAPGSGFPTHPHRDMEIITYVLAGALEHKDSTGGGSIIRPGEVQRMTAGSGIRHSEHNPSSDEPVHLLQIWILPSAKGLAPGYDQRQFKMNTDAAGWQLLCSPDGRDDSILIHQDVNLYLGEVRAGHTLTRNVPSGRFAWVQVVRGGMSVGEQMLEAGDAFSLPGPAEVELAASNSADVLWFDLG